MPGRIMYEYGTDSIGILARSMLKWSSDDSSGSPKPTPPASGPGRPLENLHPVVVHEPLLERLAVHLDDPVAGPDAQAVRGRALDGGQHGELFLHGIEPAAHP